MTILVGTDFSRTAAIAVDAAAELARARNEELVVVHLVDGVVQSQDRAAMLDEESRLTRPHPRPLRVRVRLEKGSATGARFAEIAEETAAVLVVVGAHGTGRRSPLGTFAQSIVRHVPASLLVVRQEPRFLSLVFQRPLRVMLSLALDDTDAGSLEGLHMLSQACDVDVELVHYRVLPEPPASARTNEELERDVVRAFGQATPRVAIRGIHVRDGFGRLDAHLADLAMRLDVDLMIVGSHHRRGLDRIRDGSVAEGLIARAPVSVLVGRAPA